MNLKAIFISLFVCLLCHNTISQVLIPSKGSGERISLNGTWKFKYIASSVIGNDSAFVDPKFDVAAWANINAPGNWELQGFAEPTYASVKEGTGLYRRTFSIPANWKGRPVYIAFDGVQYGYQVWVNGKFAGSFSSSFNRQTFDISRFIEPGKAATLALRVSTRSKGWEFDTNDCWALSGIIRDVTLFSLPATHLKDLVVKTYVGSANATLTVSALIEKVASSSFAKNTSVLAKLVDPDGRLIKEFNLKGNKIAHRTDTVSFSERLNIPAPRLWTAETPNLYTLDIIVKSKNTELQRYSQKVGIREVTWTNGILKLNGVAIKLRGVNNHDLSPVNGRALSEAEMKHDLDLIRKANANFIRTSHYQPHPRLVELCDSLGFYMMVEVPYGFGDQHLSDVSYLPLLKERAKATVWRDKNQASVIIWSVGNENPITPIGLETGKYVEQLDDTRPYCFPQVGSYFRRVSATFPDSIHILAPHYPEVAILNEYSNKFNRPMIVTEYAHSLGLDFDRMEALWEIMYASPKMAGGAVWHFFDQGILRKSPEKTTPGTFTTAAWIDSTTYYDTHADDGADGLVYANRIPQVDYWQTRKVYTPVKPLDDTLNVSPGRQTVQVKLVNRYDFTNLDQVQCTWTLYADTSVLQTGNPSLSCAPHDTLALAISINLPEKLTASYYYLKLQFKDKHGYSFYEKTYPLSDGKYHSNFKQRLYSTSSKPSFNKKDQISFGNYNFLLNTQTGMIRLADRAGSTLLVDGPYARLGRKTTLSEQASIRRLQPGNNPFWKPNLLTKPEAKVERVTANRIVVNYNHERQDTKGQFIEGTVEYTVSDSGRIDVSYRFVPNNAKGLALEAGLSFLVPASLTEFRWSGKGPYASYPGKNRLNEFGLHHLNKADINYGGNHQDVDVAVFSDGEGKGFAILADKANIAVENSTEGIIVSHNAYVSGRFNKASQPELKVRIENLKEIAGKFSIVPLGSKWPDTLEKLFGKPATLAVPFAPFYNSYDQ
ncbi:MAG: DUF4981 domain-containing protein [Sphingobacteriaceae bacterium]|nr:DUF4981 domain-containing protein [Sphingobacteriaceae bacterium]